ncbi:repair protein Rad1/Rec1/Rad17-domain-containing protein, partial [Armillaria mellea]
MDPRINMPKYRVVSHFNAKRCLNLRETFLSITGINCNKKVGDGKIQQFFGGSSEKRTSYAGAGYPLTLLLAEDSTGPTTTCEISMYDAEPHLELPFDLEKIVLKIILKSEWLRDALSELDPSCEKLMFIGNPLPREDPSDQQVKGRVEADAAYPSYRNIRQH